MGSAADDRRTRVSYTLREPEAEQHRFAVNAVRCLPGEQDVVFTAGRDGFVREYDVQPKGLALRGRFAQHVDWVNSLAVCDDIGFLLSASSDASVKVWTLASRQCVATLDKHKDYVKALCYTPKMRHFVTAGLDGRIIVHDLSSLRDVQSTEIHHSDCSFYSLALNADASLVAAGASDHIIRLWDPRARKQLHSLKGHQDNIRDLFMSEDGNHLLSCSADCNIKLWDIRRQQCVSTLGVHEASVWAMACSSDLSKLYSADRLGSVLVTDLRKAQEQTLSSQLLAAFDQPVTSLCLDEQRQRLWVSSLDCSVSAWDLQGTTSSAADAALGASSAESEFVEATALLTEPLLRLEGAPAIVKHQLLPDRERALTQYSDGHYVLINIVTGERTPLDSTNSFDDTYDSIECLQQVPSWCALEHKLGCLTVHLEASSAFKAWKLLDLHNVDDARINLGAAVLQSLHREWFVRSRILMKQQSDPSFKPLDSWIEAVRAEAVAAGFQHDIFDLPETAIVSVTLQSQVLAAESVQALAFPANFQLYDVRLPIWVTSVLTQPQHIGANPCDKIQFHLLPAEGAETAMGALDSSFLTCMSCLPAWRLARHAHNRLPLVANEIAAREGEPTRWQATRPEIGSQVADYLEILCNDQVRLVCQSDKASMLVAGQETGSEADQPMGQPGEASTSCTNVILLGATGSLAKKYLWQAFFELAATQPQHSFAFFGAARAAPADGEALLRTILSERIHCSDLIEACDSEMLDAFRQPVRYAQLKKDADFEALGKRLQSLSDRASCDALVYLSIPPGAYISTAASVSQHLRPKGAGQIKIVIEKPFGSNTESAVELGQGLHEQFAEEQIYRIDHYLGKRGVAQIVPFVHHNAHALHRLDIQRVLSHVAVHMFETEDCEGRTRFFDEYGIIRDVMQNHLTEVMLAALSFVMPLTGHGNYLAYKDSMLMQGKRAIISSGKAFEARRANATMTFADGTEILFHIQGDGQPAHVAIPAEGADFGNIAAPADWTEKTVGPQRLFFPPATLGSDVAYSHLIQQIFAGNRDAFVTDDNLVASWQLWDQVLEMADEMPIRGGAQVAFDYRYDLHYVRAAHDEL
ncbi:uncharacterized protein MONBRDRAFT_29733 [Monosiga brevicollis MX1]|uniref:Glucose-6-phosphate 1-dehydrogenase n=1 Tax=Monosiga brevicollis TaxID=81824 RepID=A9VBZ0_MONBE|nr:uncharacterized protein MONBRDRAFT_29733 [Monosiga brevicollis MX1]EDQ84934.1 predicted protein [Monosiga brevicollis MX1]|eukprot:XP_001750275.1 hypothetical protein [Monosiga brevicollis MX1]